MTRMRLQTKGERIPEELADWIDKQIDLRFQKIRNEHQDSLVKTIVGMESLEMGAWLSVLMAVANKLQGEEAETFVSTLISANLNGEAAQLTQRRYLTDGASPYLNLRLEIASERFVKALQHVEKLCELLDARHLAEYKEASNRIYSLAESDLARLLRLKADTTPQDGESTVRALLDGDDFTLRNLG